MGKIRVKTIGDQSQEQEQKDKRKQQREGKRLAHVAGMKGGERAVTVGVSEEEIAKTLESPAQDSTIKTQEETKGKRSGDSKSQSKYAKKTGKGKVKTGKRYKENLSTVKATDNYTVSKAVELLKKLKSTKFDETVELHVNVAEKGISGSLRLPHGTGKTLRIVLATDEIIAEIEKNHLNFDVLVATPDMMPKLAKVARVLGPRGLMPNPKNGTITTTPEETIKKLSSGQINYKTESAAPIINLSVGKLSFKENQIEENLKSVIASIGVTKITSATLKSTMSPGIRIDCTK